MALVSILKLKFVPLCKVGMLTALCIVWTTTRLHGQRTVTATSTQSITVQDICEGHSADSAAQPDFQLSPDGRDVAYLKLVRQDTRVRAELHLIDSATGRERVLIDADKMDSIFPHKPISMQESEKLTGPEVLGFQWSPSGRGILLFATSSLVWLDPTTGTTRNLLNGEDAVAEATVSPDGRWVSFVRQHNLWILSSSGGAARPITRGGTEVVRKGELDWLYPAELGTKTAYWWSPDSSSIAYLEFNLTGVASYSPPFHSDEDSKADPIDYPTPGTRNPAVRVFTVRVNGDASAAAMYTGPEQDVYLPRVQWLPDSRRLAIERLNRKQTKLDLLLAEADTGASKTLLTDSDPYWINLSDDLYFLEHSPRFVWSSERSGYRHLYLYGLDGKLVTPLTHGDWEVSKLAAVEEREKRVYFTSTEKSALERHLYSVNLDGTGMKRISVEPGTHQVSFSRNASRYIDSYSTATTPPTQSVFNSAGVKMTSLDAAGSKKALNAVEFLAVKSHDNVNLDAMMIKPSGFRPDHKYPVIVYIGGGPGSQGVHDAWDGAVSLWLQLLAERGYIVFSIDNRGSSGRGHLFEEYIHLRFGGEDISDQRDGVNYLRALPYVDPQHISIWGRGFGGALAVQAMFNPPLVFETGFAVAPVVDWMRYDSAFTERYLGDTSGNQDGYLASSPLENARRFQGPMLVIQGTDDLYVHPDQAMELSHELLEVQKYAEVSLFPGQSHAIDETDACTVMYQRATDFFANRIE